MKVGILSDQFYQPKQLQNEKKATLSNYTNVIFVNSINKSNKPPAIIAKMTCMGIVYSIFNQGLYSHYRVDFC